MKKLQDEINNLYDWAYQDALEGNTDHKTAHTTEATQTIEKDILELIGEDELSDDPRDFHYEIRNELRAGLRLKLKEYMGGNSA